jgi:hypothetical protein
MTSIKLTLVLLISFFLTSKLLADELFFLPDEVFLFEHDLTKNIKNSQNEIIILTSKFENIVIFKALKNKTKQDINITIIADKQEVISENNLVSALAIYKNCDIKITQGLQKTAQQSDAILIDNKILYIFSSKMNKYDFYRDVSLIYKSKNLEVISKFKNYFKIILERSENYLK